MPSAIITDPFCPHRGGKTKMTTGSGASMVLASGELFVEYPDAGVGKGKSKIKIGDGVTAYSSLPYALGDDTGSDIVDFVESTATTVTDALNEVISGATLGTIVAGLKKAISNLDRDVDTDINDINDAINDLNDDIGNIKGDISNINDTIDGIDDDVDTITEHLTASNNTPFRFGYDSTTQKYGYILNQGGADTVIPFKGETIHTETYVASTKNSALDMGEIHTYRYVDTSGIANANSGTYTFPANDTGGTKDLGETNTYRYVNATNVYNKGKADGDVKHTVGIEVGTNNSKYSCAGCKVYVDGTLVGSWSYGDGHARDWSSRHDYTV